ncbi:MAG: NADH-quinone oxidoreductase subunit NuoH [Deltaproteobacteria bacterium]|nr:MAG: NADH-quinone oxidoreductase subunit NuoH [Deltaproteobacteria bacterium]
MAVDVTITAGKALFAILLALQVVGLGVFFERKVSAVIQDRIGANRAAILGFAGLGLVNTLVADPIKFLLKEDITPAAVDRLLHTLAPLVSLVPALLPFAVIPFGDVLQIGDRTINLQAAELNVGILFVLAMASLGVYGVVLGGWASNNRWSLLGSIRGSAQMISYEIAMGLALIGVVLTYNTLDLQEMARQQGRLVWGWLPAWGILYQPVAFLIFFTAGVAESKRIPFDLPEAESELVSGYFTEYSGAKHLMFMMSDFVEVVLVAALVTTLFFGGWQLPYLLRDGFHFPWGAAVALPSWAVALLQVMSFAVKLVFFTWLQIVIRWTLPRFRYDQLMRLGWQGLLPLALANVVVSALVIVLAAGPAA